MIIKLDRTMIKRQLWHRAYDKLVNSIIKDINDDVFSGTEEDAKKEAKKLVLYGIKCEGAYRKKQVKRDETTAFRQMDKTLLFMRLLTPNEFTQLFPIEKEFDGEKHGTKDYFTTMAYIEKIGADKPIEEPFEFLWEYHNRDVRLFLVNFTSAMSGMYRERTGVGLIEDYFKEV